MLTYNDLSSLIMSIIIPIILLFTFVIAPLTVIYYFGTKYKCEAKATAQGMEWSYDAAKGCMIKTENGWMDYNRIIYKIDVK